MDLRHAQVRRGGLYGSGRGGRTPSAVRHVWWKCALSIILAEDFVISESSDESDSLPDDILLDSDFFKTRANREWHFLQPHFATQLTRFYVHRCGFGS